MEHSPYIEASSRQRNQHRKLPPIASLKSDEEEDDPFRIIYREDDSRHEQLHTDKKLNDFDTKKEAAAMLSVSRRDLPSLSPYRKVFDAPIHEQGQQHLDEDILAPILSKRSIVKKRSSRELSQSTAGDDQRIMKKRSFALDNDDVSDATPPSILATRSEDYSSYSYHKRHISNLADLADRSGEIPLFQEAKIDNSLSFESAASLPFW